MLELSHLTKRYGGTFAVQDVSFVLKPGEIVGYLGPNGSGKSTTVKMITGLVEPTAGQVLFEGRDIRHDPVGYKRRLGYVPEEAHLYSHLSAMEYLELVGRLRQMPENLLRSKASELLRLSSLGEAKHATISSYSKGMKQRVLIAAALMHNPDLLIFDEPLSGLDVESAQLFKELLQGLSRAGKAILYISHVLETVERVCKRVVVIYRGRIRADASVAELTSLTKLPDLEHVFAQLVTQQDAASTARAVIETIGVRDAMA